MHFRKWNFVALIFKNFLYFLKKETFLIFREMETPKNFLIFQKTELSYISRNGNPQKLLIFQEVTFRAQKIQKKLKNVLHFKK